MKTEVLDLRDDLRRGCGPFGKIMTAAARVEAGDRLLLLAPFEPIPLFSVMTQQGFEHSTRQLDSGDWEICFTRTAPAAGIMSTDSPAESSCGCSAASPLLEPTSVAEVDTRGLQPPQPLVMILETVATLPANNELRAHTDRRPMHLYPELEARGFSSQTEEQNDGSFITTIRRRA